MNLKIKGQTLLLFTTGYEFLPLNQSIGIEFMEEDQKAE
jgi:hypothetical protein